MSPWQHSRRRSDSRGIWAPRLTLAAAALACSALLPNSALAATVKAARVSSGQSDAAVRWGLLIGFGSGAVLVVALAVFGTGRALVIGTDNRLSTSKTIAAGWT